MSDESVALVTPLIHLPYMTLSCQFYYQILQMEHFEVLASTANYLAPSLPQAFDLLLLNLP